MDEQIGYKRDLFLLLVYYSQLRRLLTSYFSGYVIYQNTEINGIYLKICNQIGSILSKKEFIELNQFEWRPIDNLLSLDLDYPEVDWEYGGQKISADFFSKIQEIFIRSGEVKPPVFLDDHNRITEFSKFLDRFDIMKKNQDEKWLKKVEIEAKKFNNSGGIKLEEAGSQMNIHNLANVILRILLEHFPNHQFLEGPKLLKEVRLETGEKNIHVSDVLDAVEFLNRKKAVDTQLISTHVPYPWNWDEVGLSLHGKQEIENNPDVFKVATKESKSSEVNIRYNYAPIQINQEGDNILFESISFVQLKDQVAKDEMLSDKGKQEILAQITVLEEENRKEKPNINRAEKALNFLKSKTPTVIYDLIINLIANLIANGLAP